MCIFKWMDNKVLKFKWFDITLLKGAVVAFTLMIVRFFPEEVLLVEWQWYFTIMILLALRPWYVIFFKK